MRASHWPEPDPALLDVRSTVALHESEESNMAQQLPLMGSMAVEAAALNTKTYDKAPRRYPHPP